MLQCCVSYMPSVISLSYIVTLRYVFLQLILVFHVLFSIQDPYIKTSRILLLKPLLCSKDTFLPSIISANAPVTLMPFTTLSLIYYSCWITLSPSILTITFSIFSPLKTASHTYSPRHTKITCICFFPLKDHHFNLPNTNSCFLSQKRYTENYAVW